LGIVKLPRGEGSRDTEVQKNGGKKGPGGKNMGGN